jgi:hypothetical protein
MPLVVAHGLPKSGSTFLYNVAREAAAIANGTTHYKSKEAFFGKGQMPDFIYELTDDVVDRILRELPEGAFFVLKTHGKLSPSLGGRVAAGQVLAFTSFRDPRDTVIAMLDAGVRDRERGADRSFAKMRSVEDTLQPVKHGFAVAHEWMTCERVLQVPYYLIAAEQDFTIRLLVRYLGLEFFCRALTAHFAVNREQRITEFNKGIADRFIDDLPPDDTLRLTQDFSTEIADTDRLTATWMSRYGYRMLYNRLAGVREKRLAALSSRVN